MSAAAPGAGAPFVPALPVTAQEFYSAGREVDGVF